MSAPLPLGVLELWAALDSGPAAAQQVCAAVMDALQSSNPRITLNKHMRGLRSRKSRPLHAVRDWLKEPDTQIQASKHGAYWALRKWQCALDRMIDNAEPAHKAFGGDKQGRRSGQGFTHAERAAIYSEYRSRGGVSLNKALGEYTSQAPASDPDINERDLRRARKGLRLKELTLSEIRTLATGPASPMPKKCAGSDKSGV